MEIKTTAQIYNEIVQKGVDYTGKYPKKWVSYDDLEKALSSLNMTIEDLNI